METKENIISSEPRNAMLSLKRLAKIYQKKLIYTFGLILVENILLLIYPLVAGFAINAIVEGQLHLALLYALVVLLMWGVGSVRKSVDTRVFANIYAKLVVPVVVAQRKDSHTHSTIVARVALSREFVNFFEQHLPVLMTSLISIVGAAIMLLFIEFWAGIACLIVLMLFVALMPVYIQKNENLYYKLNNRLEKESDYVRNAAETSLNRHYGLMAKLRIRISDREAFGYLIIGLTAASLFALVIILLSTRGHHKAGHIYAVMTYLWTFAQSLDDGPELVEKFAKLKDIGKRVNTGLA